MNLDQAAFNSELYLPGTSGEAHLFKTFKQASGLDTSMRA